MIDDTKKVEGNHSSKSEDFASPEWHGEVLQQRLESVENGEAEFYSLDTVRLRFLAAQLRGNPKLLDELDVKGL